MQPVGKMVSMQQEKNSTENKKEQNTTQNSLKILQALE